MDQMKEFRCKFCHRLLAKIGEAKLVEIKCPKCKTLNAWSEERIVALQIPAGVLQKKIMENRVKYDLMQT